MKTDPGWRYRFFYIAVIALTSFDSSQTQSLHLLTAGIVPVSDKVPTTEKSLFAEPQNKENRLSSRLGLKTVYGTSNGTSYIWKYPKRICRSADGRLFVLDVGNRCIKVYDSKMRYLLEIGKDQNGKEILFQPTDITYMKNKLYVLDGVSKSVKIFYSDGKFKGEIALPAMTMYFAVDQVGSIYSANTNSSSMFAKLDSMGSTLRNFGEPIDKGPQSGSKNWAILKYDQKSNEVVAAFVFLPRVQVYSTEGKLLRDFTVRSKIVNELAATSNEKQSGPPRLVFISYDIIRNSDNYCVLLAHGTETAYACLYVCSLNGEKVCELPLLDKSGKPISNAESVCADANGRYFITTPDNKILMYQLSRE